VTPLGAAEAAQRILSDVRRQPGLRIPLDDALGSVLAEDVVSRLDIPAWTNSAMDGYAARAADIRGATESRPVRLRVVEHLPAGHFPTRRVGRGECARIFTGAPLPEGADSVVRQEDTDGGSEVVTILKDRDAGVTSAKPARISGRTAWCFGPEPSWVRRSWAYWRPWQWLTRWCIVAPGLRSWEAETRSSTSISRKRS
jgi:molybdopterin biosynthesis enzyme